MRLRWLALSLAALFLPAPAWSRARLELTVEPGVAIPLNRFVDTTGDGGAHLTMENKVGFSLNIALLLNNWEFHYGMNQARIGTLDLRLAEDDWNTASQVLAQYGQDLPREVVTDFDGSFVFHSLTLGYRFYVMDRAGWRLFIPNGVGASIVTGEGTSRPLFGGSATVGFGVDWQFIPNLPYVLLNLTTRYTFHVSELDQAYTGLSLIQGGSPWDSAVAMMHLLTFNLGIAGRW